MVDLVAGRAGVEVAELVAAEAGDVLAIVVMIGVVRVVKAAMTGVGRVVMIEVKTGVGRVVSGSRVVKVGMNVVARVVTIVVGRVVSGSRVVRVVMIAVVSGVGRVVSGSRVVRVVMIAVVSGVGRVGSGSRVVKVGMNVVARVVTIVVGRVVSGSRVARAVMTVVVHVAMGNVMTAVRDSVMIAMMRQSLRRSSVARRCSRVRARASTAKTNRLPTAKIGMSVSSTRARFVASAFGVANPSARSAGRGGIEVARRSQHRPL